MTHFLAGVLVGAIAVAAGYLWWVVRPIRIRLEADLDEPWGDA